MASGEGDRGLLSILDGVLAKEGEGVRKPGERARTRVVVRWRIEELRVEDMSVNRHSLRNAVHIAHMLQATDTDPRFSFMSRVPWGAGQHIKILIETFVGGSRPKPS